MLTQRSSSAADLSGESSRLGGSPSRGMSPPSPVSTGSRDHVHGGVILPPSLAALTGRAASRGKAAGVAPYVTRTLGWVALAACVALCVAALKGRARGLEFVTAYLVEYSLSVDNLFVFLLIFKFFRVPREAQQKVLMWGIVGAMGLRGVMIVMGRMLTQRFEWVAVLFAVFLVYSAGKLLWEGEDADGDVEDNAVIRFVQRCVPVGERYAGERFFLAEGGRIVATPLVVVLVAIELSDVVFALDSVPAVLGISDDLFVIYVSNMLAVMGLRSLFFVLARCIGSIRFLRHSLAVVLAFIGGKMLATCAGLHVSTGVSLAVVVVTLGGGVAVSMLWPKREEEVAGDACV